MTFRKRLIQAMPMISLLLFLLLGFQFDKWHPGWVVFFLIPLSTIILTGDFKRRLRGSMPLVALMLFLVIGIWTDRWHPTWVVFLLIPLSDIVLADRISIRSLIAICVSAVYIVVSLIIGAWHPTWLILFLIPIINTLFFPHKSWIVFNSSSGIKRQFRHFMYDEKDTDGDDDYIINPK